MPKLVVKILGLIITLFLSWPSFAQAAEPLCSKVGYTVATVNGINTTESEASNNLDALTRKVKRLVPLEPIKYHYFYNETNGAVLDGLDAIRQKTFNVTDTTDPDFLKIWKDASAKVTTQKLLLVAHSQGNFYANDLYNVVVGNNDLSPKSMGVYSVATPANYVAGKGKHLTSSTDKVIAGYLNNGTIGGILEPNIKIDYLPTDDEGNGHNFEKVYLHYESGRIIDDIKLSLAKLETDQKKSENTPCINPPAELQKSIVKINQVLRVAAVVDSVALSSRKIVLDGIRAYPGALAALGYNGLLAAGDVIISFTQLLSGGPSIADGNAAAIILATMQGSQSGAAPATPPASPNTSNGSSAKKSSSANPANKKTVSVPVFVKVPPQETTDSAEGEQSSMPKLVFVGMQNVPMSFGGGFAPEFLAATDEAERATESFTATSSEPAVVPDGIVFATTSAPIYAVNPVVFSGEYYNSGSTFDTINLEIKNTSLENATTSVAFSAQVATTGVALLFTKEVEMTDSGLFEYRVRLENSTNASSTPWSTSDFFTVNFATTTASSTPAVATTTYALVFETPNSANVLSSDLNKNGVADSEEDDVVASSSAWLAAGEYVFNNLTITNKATITAAGNENSSSTFKGVKLFAKNLSVETGANISADGQGYKTRPGYTTPVGLASDPSASYGGSGGGDSRYYGSAIRPTDLGSGKGTRGGGAIQIIVTNDFTNNGKISANGASTGTSGGSIYVNANKFSGAGSFSSNGTGVNWPIGIGGGGGRIALHYAQSSFSGSVGALGGSGSWGRGGEGTVGFFDKTSNDAYLKNTFRFQKNDEPFNFHNIYISNGAWIGVDEGVILTAENIFVDSAAHFSVANNVVLKSQSILASGSSFITLGSGVALDVPVVTIGHKSNLSLLSEDTLVANSLIFRDGGTLTSGVKKAVFIDVSNLEVSTSSAISAWVSAAESNPDNLFISGEGASVYIKSSGKLIINGTISANAPQGKIGGGIYVDTNELAGMGTIVSQGGSMVWEGYYVGYKGPFAGGNIAVYYATSSFAGTATAPGACGSYDGWSKTCAGNGKVVVDNISNKPAMLLPPPPVILSSEKALLTFDLLVATSTISGVVDEGAHTISLTVPGGTDVHALVPTIITSPLATSSPTSFAPQDFTNPVTYTITAEDGSTQVYVVSVVVEAPPAALLPIISSYTFNGIAGNITADFATTTPTIELSLAANKDVDWVSVTIEYQADTTKYKRFYSGAGCADGMAVCVKTWDGVLSGGEEALNGVYRIKAHIKDTDGNDYNDYLLPYTITINREAI